MKGLVGKTLAGRYRVTGVLGRGGMGCVYRATDQRLHGRECAIKVLRIVDDAETEDRARFERELRIISMLRCRHTVQVTDSGELMDGRPYIVMEVLHGAPLSRVLTDHGPMAPEVAVSVVADVLRALVEAHALGVVHRDLKPGNIFLAHDPSGGTVAKVLDFGIAKQLRAGDAELTQGSGMVGTPRYMAPEQCRRVGVDERSDLYAVGVLLYCMLEARPPFSEDDPVPEDVALLAPSTRLTWLQIYASPPPVTDVSPALAAVYLRLMEKRPADRFPDASSVIEALMETPEGVELQPVPLPHLATDPVGDVVPLAEPSETPMIGELVEPPTRRRLWPWALLAAGVGALFAIPTHDEDEPAPPPPVVVQAPPPVRAPVAVGPPPVEAPPEPVLAPPDAALPDAEPVKPKRRRHRVTKRAPPPAPAAPPPADTGAPPKSPDPAPILFY